MLYYQIPKFKNPEPIASNQAILVANGDSRLAANQMCWPAQEEMESRLVAAFAGEGIQLLRSHPHDKSQGHGFISSQRMGMDVFQNIHPDARVVVAEAVWQYSHHSQLEWRMARFGWSSESQRLSDKDAGPIQHDMERGFHRRLFHQWA